MIFRVVGKGVCFWYQGKEIHLTLNFSLASMLSLELYDASRGSQRGLPFGDYVRGPRFALGHIEY